MKLTFALAIAALAGSSLVGAAPAAGRELDTRAEKVNAIRAMRSYVELEARDHPGKHDNGHGHEDNGPHGPPAGRPGPPGPPAPAPKDEDAQGNKGKGRGWGKGGRPGNPGKHTGFDHQNDPHNCGQPYFVCPESYNGVGQPVCEYGQCKLKCPPGLRQFLTNHQFPTTFCA